MMKFFLKLYHSEIKLQAHELTKQLYFIGRSDNCHIKVSGSFVSRCHLTLSLGRDGERFCYTAYDGNIMSSKLSTSGLYINKIRVSSGRKLKSGDIIDFVETPNMAYPCLEYFEESEEFQTDIPTGSYEFEQQRTA